MVAEPAGSGRRPVRHPLQPRAVPPVRVPPLWRCVAFRLCPSAGIDQPGGGVGGRRGRRQQLAVLIYVAAVIVLVVTLAIAGDPGR